MFAMKLLLTISYSGLYSVVGLNQFVLVHENQLLKCPRISELGKISAFSPAAMPTASFDGAQMGQPAHDPSTQTPSELAACTAVGGNEGKHGLSSPH